MRNLLTFVSFLGLSSAALAGTPAVLATQGGFVAKGFEATRTAPAKVAFKLGDEQRKLGTAHVSMKIRDVLPAGMSPKAFRNSLIGVSNGGLVSLSSTSVAPRLTGKGRAGTISFDLSQSPGGVWSPKHSGDGTRNVMLQFKGGTVGRIALDAPSVRVDRSVMSLDIARNDLANSERAIPSLEQSIGEYAAAQKAATNPGRVAQLADAIKATRGQLRVFERQAARARSEIKRYEKSGDWTTWK